MLNSIEVYNTMGTETTLDFVEAGSIENDIIQVKNIDGLDPVKADINQVAAATRDGLSSIDSDVASRNIVITLRPNPDWSTWAPETIRKFIYSYFMPKTTVKLVFDSDEVGVVEIFGIIESCDANPFSQEPEYIISIICEDPYFTAVAITSIDGNIINPSDWSTGATDVPIVGTVPIGIKVQIPWGDLTGAQIQTQSPSTSIFEVDYTETSVLVEMNSVPGSKYIRSINQTNGVFINILDKVSSGSEWPLLQPGDNKFAVLADGYTGLGYVWNLSFYQKFGGI